MSDKTEIQEAVIEVLRSDEFKKILVDAMAVKLEMTAGWDCSSASERMEIRKDQEFLRSMRQSVHSIAQKVVFGIVAIVLAGALAWAGFKQ